MDARMLTRMDRIDGSNEMARAIWALGVLGGEVVDFRANAADIARCIRARTPLNWEGPQASRFFRKRARDPHFEGEMVEAGMRVRFRFGLTELGKQAFISHFVDGKAPDLPPYQRLAPDAFRSKDQGLSGKNRMIARLRADNRRLQGLVDRFVKLAKDAEAHLRKGSL